MDTTTNAVPTAPRWMAPVACVAGVGVGAWAAIDLDYPGGVLWLTGIAAATGVACLGVIVGIVTRGNPARSRPPVRRALVATRLLSLFVIAQLPALVWRLDAGDPDVRTAKAYSEEIADATWSRFADEGRLGREMDATLLPGERDLPRFVHQHGLWFGLRDGRAYMGFQRTRGDVVDEYSYDIERGDWSRARTVERP